MTLTEIEHDDIVKNNIIIYRPDDPDYPTMYDYTPELYGIHRVRMTFLLSKSVLDYTKNTDIAWEASFEKEIKTGCLNWQNFESLYRKCWKIENLTVNNLHEIVLNNTVYLSNLVKMYENLKIINELCTK
jgi:hypothetical protein